MAITRGTSVAANSGGTGTGFTIANVTCSGSDRYLSVLVGLAATTASVSSVTFNGVESATLVDSRNTAAGTGNQCRIERWELVAPTATTANVVVVTTSAISAGIATPRAGVNQATPRDAVVKAGGTSTAPALTAELAWGGGDDEQELMLVWRNGTYTFTADAGVTLVAESTSGVGASHVGIATLVDADTETGKVVGALSTSTGWGIVSMNLNAAGGGGGSAIAAISNYYALRGLR